MLAKNFVKYVGGKNKLKSEIVSLFPEYNNYYELFVGGGSVFFEAFHSNSNKKTKFTISDLNESLINCYIVIKQNVNELVNELSKKKYKNNEQAFYKFRDRFNKLKFIKEKGNEIEKAALFIYLNRCCFNGVYRENQAGFFNVPFGKHSNPLICDTELLLAVHKALKRVSIYYKDYSFFSSKIKQGDLVYLDPPYDESYNQYTCHGFGKKEQVQLKEFIDKLTEKGVYVVLSNSNTSFIKKLYKDYKKKILTTIYQVSCASPSKVKELLICNF